MSASKPSPEQLSALNVRIAELMPTVYDAWRFPDDTVGLFDIIGAGKTWPKDRYNAELIPRPWPPGTLRDATGIPNFTGSLDAIHEAVAALTGTPEARKKGLDMKYGTQLYRVVAEAVEMPGVYDLATADALPFAIALDRTSPCEPHLSKCQPILP